MDRRNKGTREAPSTPCFVKKLYEMMTFNTNILTWVNGDAFEILDPVRLENEVLPFFFRHCRFQSLVRQLNFYAFKKISKERNSWVYSHEFFQRDRPELLDGLRRKTNSFHQSAHPPSKPHQRKQLDDSSSSNGSLGGGQSGVEYEAARELAGAAAVPMEVEDGTSADEERSQSTADSHDSLLDDDHDHRAPATATASAASAASAGQDASQYSFDMAAVLRSPLRCELLPLSLQLFCMRRNPWLHPHTLLPEIRSLLSLNLALEMEFFDYVRALESPENLSSVLCGEVVALRYFLMFAVTRLQMAQYFVDEHRKQLQQQQQVSRSQSMVKEEEYGQEEEEEPCSVRALGVCLEAWLSYTRSCL